MCIWKVCGWNHLCWASTVFTGQGWGLVEKDQRSLPWDSQPWALVTQRSNIWSRRQSLPPLPLGHVKVPEPSVQSISHQAIRGVGEESSVLISLPLQISSLSTRPSGSRALCCSLPHSSQGCSSGQEIPLVIDSSAWRQLEVHSGILPWSTPESYSPAPSRGVSLF